MPLPFDVEAETKRPIPLVIFFLQLKFGIVRVSENLNEDRKWCRNLLRIYPPLMKGESTRP